MFVGPKTCEGRNTRRSSKASQMEEKYVMAYMDTKVIMYWLLKGLELKSTHALKSMLNLHSPSLVIDVSH